MSQLKKLYAKEAVPALMRRHGYKNIHEAPRLVKVVINVGLNSQHKDPKLADTAMDTLRRITGQSALKTKAKKSIAGFKVRKGMVVGAKVTLRGDRMYDFIERLVRVTLPRMRDFRGLPEKLVDKSGNMSIGFRDVIAFPEVQSDAMERAHGLEVSINTSVKNRDDGLELFRLLGFPFREK